MSYDIPDSPYRIRKMRNPLRTDGPYWMIEGGVMTLGPFPSYDDAMQALLRLEEA